MTTNYINELMRTLQNYVKTNPDNCWFNYLKTRSEMDFNGSRISIRMMNGARLGGYSIFIGDDEAINETDSLNGEIKQLYIDISNIAEQRNLKAENEKRNNVCKNFLDGLKR